MEFAFFLYLFQGTEAMIRAQRKQSNRSKKFKKEIQVSKQKKKFKQKRNSKNQKRKGAAR